MPARPPPVTRCGDLETACTDELLYFAAVLGSSTGSSPESECVSDQAFYSSG